MSTHGPLTPEVFLDELLDALIAITPAGNVLYWNRGAEQVFGYSRADAIGHDLDALIIPVDRIEESHIARQRAITHGYATFESVRRHRTGRAVYVDVSMKVVRAPDQSGEISFIAMSFK